MNQLDLSARMPLLDVQVEADERERDRDRLRAVVSRLRRIGIDDVLMDERRIAARQRVGAQLFIGFTL